MTCEPEPAPTPPGHVPATIDPDEWHYLPERPCVPVERLNAAGEAEVRLYRGKGLRVMPIYSSPELLAAACGPSQSYAQVPQRDLPEWADTLGFHVVMVDRELPPEFQRHDEPDEAPRERPLAIDPRSGDPAWLAPTRVPVSSEEAEPEMRYLADDRLALMLYSSEEAIIEAYGRGQPYMVVPTDQLDEVLSQLDADCTLVDALVPAERSGRRKGVRDG